MKLTNTAKRLLVVGLFVVSGFAEAQDIKIVTEELPPYNYTDNGVVTGMATEVVRAVLDELELRVDDIRVYPWARAYKSALEQPNVLIYSISRTPEREELFKWVGEVAPLNIYLFKLAARTDIQLVTLENAKQYLIGVGRDSAPEQYLMLKGFVKKKHLDNTGNLKQNLLKLVNQRVDLVPTTELSFFYQARLLGYDPALFTKARKIEELSKLLYMAFSRQTSDELVDRFRKALEAVKNQGVYDAIQQKYLR